MKRKLLTLVCHFHNAVEILFGLNIKNKYDHLGPMIINYTDKNLSMTMLKNILEKPLKQNVKWSING